MVPHEQKDQFCIKKVLGISSTLSLVLQTTTDLIVSAVANTSLTVLAVIGVLSGVHVATLRSTGTFALMVPPITGTLGRRSSGGRGRGRCWWCQAATHLIVAPAIADSTFTVLTVKSV